MKEEEFWRQYFTAKVELDQTKVWKETGTDNPFKNILKDKNEPSNIIITSIFNEKQSW